LFTGPVNGNPTLYVVGTDGKLHGFATPEQYLPDGYDVALVVTVPSLGGLSVGSTAGAEGAAATALATSSDGAIVDSSGTFYVFAGGKAFGIATPPEVAAVRHADNAMVLYGSVGRAQIGAAVADGALLSSPSGVYISYEGILYPFKTMAQLANDGYGGTASVTGPGTGGLLAAFPYSGS
jgi:hypothetical protein